MIHPQSKVVFHRLRRSVYPDNRGEFAIVRWDTDSSVKTAPEVVELIALLSKGATVQQAAHETHLSVAEVIDIIANLQDVGFVKQIDHHTLADNEVKIKPWLSQVNRDWFRWIISKPVQYTAFVFTIVGLMIGIFTPGYFPSYKDYFWTDDYFLVFVSVTALSMIFLFLHEVAHFAVTKAVGGEAVIRFSSRFIYVVAETESYHLAVLPKSLRFLVYFAGMFADFFVIAVIYWLFFYFDVQGIRHGVVRGIMTVVVLSNIQGIVWQYNAFLETDMYNFLSDYLSHENLHLNTRRYLAKQLNYLAAYLPFRSKQRPGDLLLTAAERADHTDTRLFLKDEQSQIFVYSFILVTGLLLTLLQYVVYTIPRDLTFLINSVANIIAAASIVALLKSLVLVVLILYPYCILLYVSIKKRG